MSAILDMVGASILFGVLMLTVARMQTNLNTTMYSNTFNLITQTAAVNLALQLEYDFTKAGYGIDGQKISKADTNAITFRAALTYGGPQDSVSYSVGNQDLLSLNPRDFRLVRRTHLTGTLQQRIGLTKFSLAYYDTANTKMTTPITTTNSLNAIRAIDVTFRLESMEPVSASDTTSYYSVTWRKLIYPRNLGKPQ